MISKVVRLSNGALYDPRLALLPNSAGTPVNFAACGNSFTVQIAKSFSLSSLSALQTDTAVPLHTFPTCAAPIAPTADDVVSGPLLIESVVMVFSANAAFSNSANPTMFAVSVGMNNESVWSDANVNLNAHKWITTGNLSGDFTAGVRTISGHPNAYVSPVSTNGANQDAYSRVADDAGNIQRVIFANQSSSLSVGVTINHQSTSTNATLTFEANFYITGRMLPPLINP